MPSFPAITKKEIGLTVWQADNREHADRSAPMILVPVFFMNISVFTEGRLTRNPLTINHCQGTHRIPWTTFAPRHLLDNFESLNNFLYILWVL